MTTINQNCLYCKKKYTTYDVSYSDFCCIGCEMDYKNISFDDLLNENLELKNIIKDFMHHSRETIRGHEAKKKLDSGFKGMGYNILIENSGRINLGIRGLKKILDKLDKE